MKLEIDWAGMLKPALKAVWPFIAGAVGGIGPKNRPMCGGKTPHDKFKTPHDETAWAA